MDEHSKQNKEKNKRDGSRNLEFCALIFPQISVGGGRRDTAKVGSAARRKNKCGRDKIWASPSLYIDDAADRDRPTNEPADRDGLQLWRIGE